MKEKRYRIEIEFLADPKTYDVFELTSLTLKTVPMTLDRAKQLASLHIGWSDWKYFEFKITELSTNRIVHEGINV